MSVIFSGGPSLFLRRRTRKTSGSQVDSLATAEIGRQKVGLNLNERLRRLISRSHSPSSLPAPRFANAHCDSIDQQHLDPFAAHVSKVQMYDVEPDGDLMNETCYVTSDLSKSPSVESGIVNGGGGCGGGAIAGAQQTSRSPSGSGVGVSVGGQRDESSGFLVNLWKHVVRLVNDSRQMPRRSRASHDQRDVKLPSPSCNARLGGASGRNAGGMGFINPACPQSPAECTETDLHSVEKLRMFSNGALDSELALGQYTALYDAGVTAPGATSCCIQCCPSCAQRRLRQTILEQQQQQQQQLNGHLIAPLSSQLCESSYSGGDAAFDGSSSERSSLNASSVQLCDPRPSPSYQNASSELLHHASVTQTPSNSSQAVPNITITYPGNASTFVVQNTPFAPAPVDYANLSRHNPRCVARQPTATVLSRRRLRRQAGEWEERASDGGSVSCGARGSTHSSLSPRPSWMRGVRRTRGRGGSGSLAVQTAPLVQTYSCPDKSKSIERALAHPKDFLVRTWPPLGRKFYRPTGVSGKFSSSLSVQFSRDLQTKPIN